MDREELIGKVAGLKDEWARMLKEHRADELDWDPLEKVLPLKWCAGFMFMGYSGNIRLYKHGFTRHYLNLDPQGNAYNWTGNRYVPMPLKDAIEQVFEGLNEIGESRSSVYDDKAIRRRHEALAKAGWKVVSLDPYDKSS
jgi:hypothetical protein